MKESMNTLKSYRMESSVFIDDENDPNETGLIGSPFSLITTDEGDLDAKLTTLDPNFSAGMVELMVQIGIEKNDTVAVLLTGSMPGGNIAVLTGLKALGAYPVVITSVGASQWGANHIDFTWLDMEKILYEESPESLPKDEYNAIHKEIAKRVLSSNKEKWNTIPRTYSEIDTLRNKFKEDKELLGIYRSGFGKYFSLEDEQIEIHFSDRWNNSEELIHVFKQTGHGKREKNGSDLTDYDSGEEVSDKIASLMKEYSKKYHNGEETEHSNKLFQLIDFLNTC